MTLIWGIAALGIYFGIIGILAQDAIDQIRSIDNERKIIDRKKGNNHRRV